MTGKEFVVTRAAAPKFDQEGIQRTDKATGKPMWQTVSFRAQTITVIDD